jgi:hypothetical protein
MIPIGIIGFAATNEVYCSPAESLGLKEGDAHVVRNAGGRA